MTDDKMTPTDAADPWLPMAVERAIERLEQSTAADTISEHRHAVITLQNFARAQLARATAAPSGGNPAALADALHDEARARRAVNGDDSEHAHQLDQWADRITAHRGATATREDKARNEGHDQPDFPLWSLAEDLDTWLYDQRKLIDAATLRPVITVRDALDAIARQAAPSARAALRDATRPEPEAEVVWLSELIDKIGEEVGIAPGQPGLVLSQVRGWMERARQTNLKYERLRDAAPQDSDSTDALARAYDHGRRATSGPAVVEAERVDPDGFARWSGPGWSVETRPGEDVQIENVRTGQCLFIPSRVLAAAALAEQAVTNGADSTGGEQ